MASDPISEPRSVRFVVTDGDGGISSAEVIEVRVELDENDATAIWRDNTDTAPQYNIFDGVRFRTENSSLDLGEWEVIQGADSPTRDETIVLGVETGTNIIRGQMWDGTSWTPLSLNDLGTANTDNYQGFDVAYEAQQRRCRDRLERRRHAEDQQLERNQLDGACHRNGLHRRQQPGR